MFINLSEEISHDIVEELFELLNMECIVEDMINELVNQHIGEDDELVGEIKIEIESYFRNPEYPNPQILDSKLLYNPLVESQLRQEIVGEALKGYLKKLINFSLTKLFSSVNYLLDIDYVKIYTIKINDKRFYINKSFDLFRVYLSV